MATMHGRPIGENRPLAVRQLEKINEVSQPIVSEVLTKDLGMELVAAKFVLRLLSPQQQDFSAPVADFPHDGHNR